MFNKVLLTQNITNAKFPPQFHLAKKKTGENDASLPNRLQKSCKNQPANYQNQEVAMHNLSLCFFGFRLRKIKQ